MTRSLEERVRLVMGLARGHTSLADVVARDGLSVDDVEIWVSELLHAAPERFDEQMLRRLVAQGLASEGGRTQQSGRMEDVAPLDLLQTLGIYRKAGRVLFFHSHGTSQLWFEGGEIVDASSGACRGAEAVYRIVGHDRGDFRVEVTGVSRARTIELPSTALIFEAARRLDESHRLGPQLPADDVVLWCEAGAPLAAGLSEAHAQVAALFGNGVTLGEVLEGSTQGDLETRRLVAELSEAGLLEATGATREPEVPSVERRVQVIRQVWLEASQPVMAPPVVAAVMSEPYELAPLRRRRPWAYALVGGFVVVLATFGVLSQSGGDEPPPVAQGAAIVDAPPVAVSGPIAVTGAVNPVGVAKVGVPEARPSVGDGAPRSEAVERQPEGSGARTRGAKRSSKRRSKSRSRSEAHSQAAPAPKARSKAPAKRDDAATLLKKARAAYDAHNGAKAYQLASQSHRLQPRGASAELKVLAACLNDQPDKARRALQDVSRSRRSNLRAACKKKHSVRIKLGRR